MRIGVDIDGVLNYHYQFMIEYGTKYCAETGRGRLTDLCTAHLSQMFNWAREERNDFWKKYGQYATCRCAVQAFAPEVLKKLRAEGNEIWIVTGRNNRDMLVDGMLAPTWEETTKLWLEQQGVEYDVIAFDHQDQLPTDKGTFCAENHIDMMIEDNPDYLRILAGKTKVIIYDTPYNREINSPKKIRVFSWYNFYQKFKEMEQK